MLAGHSSTVKWQTGRRNKELLLIVTIPYLAALMIGNGSSNQRGGRRGTLDP